METHDLALIHSSDDPNWRTPNPCFDLLNAEFGFGLDAAATANDRKVHMYFGPDHGLTHLRDALAVNWHDYAPEQPIFLNPPYSRKQYRLTKNPAMAIESWARKCWLEAKAGCTIVGIFPFAPQTSWYTAYVMGQGIDGDFAASEERRLPHRISFMRADGGKAGNAGVNSVIIVWKPQLGKVWPWVPATSYWTYRNQPLLAAEDEARVAFERHLLEAA